MLDDVGKRRLRRDEQRGRKRTEAVGAHAYLGGGLLGGDQETARPGGGHRAEHLQEQRALAHAGLPGQERDRTRNQAAAEHTVELANAGGAHGRGRGAHLEQRDGRVACRARAERRDARRDRLLDE